MNDNWMFDWHEAEASGPAVVGGKGWNLGRLSRYGFKIPSGGVLSSAAYVRFMSDSILNQHRKRLQVISEEEAHEPVHARQLEEMQAAISDTPMPDEIVKSVAEFLHRNDLGNVPVAVRSSATAEDSADASFAGIHTSRLGQVGVDAVVDGIRSCYASLWTPRAVAYRRRLGLSDSEVLCAVVLCRMVGMGGDPNKEPVAAGVAFSCDPRTGRFDVVTIGAVSGLGDKLVDGRTNPDEMTVSVAPDPEIVERREKRRENGNSVLDDKQALELAHIVQRIQSALGDGQEPQDVEWAFDGASFWIVQARPVTQIPRHTFAGAKKLPVVWSNANLKDALPGILSPLGWSLTVSIVRHNLFAPHMASGYRIPPGLESIRRFSGRAYFDLTSLFWAFYDALGMSPSEFNRSMGGHQPEFSVPEINPMKGPHSRRRNRHRMKVFRTVWRLDKTLPKEIEHRINNAQKQRDIDLTQFTMTQLRQYLQDQTLLAYQFGPRSMLANTSAGLWHEFLETVIAKVAPDETAVLASNLMAGSGNVVSAEHGYRLYNLAEAAKDDGAARAMLEHEKLDSSAWKRLSDSSPFRREMERFLGDFGHRAVYEVDIANPRWIEDPTYILQQVRLLLEEDTDDQFRRSGEERRLEAERAIARRTVILRPLVRWLASRARHGFAMREAAKSALVSHLEPSRNVALEVGRRMAASDILDEPDDIFNLTWIEIAAYMDARWDGQGAKELVSDRKAQREVWLTEKPPDVIIEDDGALHAKQPSGSSFVEPDSPSPSEHGGQTLKGAGVAAGIASGRVRVLYHPDDGHQLARGEVLVAPSTDPGWTPLFMRAAAIVMEAGGYHSHGATVAREFGIPAVANIPNLLSMLRDGEVITVNGNTGAINREGGK